VTRRIFGTKKDEMTGWRKQHCDDLHNRHTSPSTIRTIKTRTMRLARYAARMGRKRMCGILVGKPDGKRPLGIPRHKWMDNNKTVLQ
jgi:hypothetical protein